MMIEKDNFDDSDDHFDDGNFEDMLEPAAEVDPQPCTSESFHRLYCSPRAGRQAGHIT